MDMGFYGQLAASMVIFAPGLILFTVFAVIGVLMLLEKAGVLGAIAERNDGKVAMAEAGIANPAPSVVVSGLNGSLSEQEAAAVRKTGTR